MNRSAVGSCHYPTSGSGVWVSRNTSQTSPRSVGGKSMPEKRRDDERVIDVSAREA